MDEIYKPENVYPEFRPVFDQLCKEFGPQYEIWRRVEDLGLSLSAAVKNPERNVAVIIRLPKKPPKTQLNAPDLQKIRKHLLSGTGDLTGVMTKSDVCWDVA